MDKEIIEIQLASHGRTSAQLSTLACAPETLCTIIAISPQKVVGPLYWGAMLNVLIVQDRAWYLLREANRSLLDDFLPLVVEHKRFFYIADKINFIKHLSVSDAAEYLINVQPCLLTTHNMARLKAVATPNTGEAIRLAEPFFVH
ncbi:MULTISPECIES: hypothetical protein [Deefgea]|uniref:Uncharacterized protein n=1 Tax=Deefgea chitinilytica TaxID=570276 RepID=A0ABS2C972_9NEIS|nr:MULTISPECIES: hypothetical protein [Deefgea]MBM5570597.1 hypothetical protein [Deefgea chitinilytica]MBM9887826.1 hypothetical protein [Deefgea sp. CFH1-16]